MKKMFFLLSVLILCFSCSQEKEVAADYNVIPLPQSVEVLQGDAFVLTSETKIVYPAGSDKLKKTAELFVDYLKISTGITLETTDQQVSDNAIVLSVESDSTNLEGYTLDVNKDLINIKGGSEAGVFYGLQTLRKSIPVEVDSKIGKVLFSAVSIKDYPRFAYRGMHLDIARHFEPVEFIKKYIDILALHNINKFHWHLTDDQGWRIEIKKYPKLTEIGSQRDETVIGRNSAVYDGKPHGGYYTQEEIKDIVAYANDRYITIIPEIDLPGHMLAAMTAYPQLGCTGGPYKVAGSWGVFDDVLCVGNENAFAFLEDVYSELIELFPSEYIHIGGDECPKDRWKVCPKCQAKIKELGIKADKKHSAEEQLQSYCISRMENFLNSKGRKIIGWDEILEGGLAPNATVMSWRGVEGAIEAAKNGHDAIMVPSSHFYFDYYQTRDIKDEPLAIGGFVPIDKVYSFEAVPDSLPASARKHIIGIQANIWTEYIPTSAQVEYMLLPRLAALSEIQWTLPEKKNYSDFMSRLFKFSKLYDKLDLNYNKAIFEVSPEIKFEGGEIIVSLSTIDKAPVFYTLDGSIPDANSTKYTEPIQINRTVNLKAVAIRDGKLSKVFEDHFNFNKATLKPLTVSVLPARNYTYNGASTLVDGKRGGDGFNDGTWIGYYGKDVEVVIDMEQIEEISTVEAGTLIAIGDWIFGATKFNIAVSDDNKNFKEVFTLDYPILEATQQPGVIDLVAKFDKTKARYVKVFIGATKSIPQWHVGKGQPSFLFLDEISVQ